MSRLDFLLLFVSYLYQKTVKAILHHFDVLSIATLLVETRVNGWNDYRVCLDEDEEVIGQSLMANCIFEDDL